MFVFADTFDRYASLKCIHQWSKVILGRICLDRFIHILIILNYDAMTFEVENVARKIRVDLVVTAKASSLGVTSLC